MTPKGDGGIAQVCHHSDYWFITLLLERTHMHACVHTNSHTVAEGGGIEETIKYICPAYPSPPPIFSTPVEIEHFCKDYWLGTQELGGRQQMRPDRAKLAAVLRLHSGWPGALGTWDVVGGEKVSCVKLKVLGHKDGESKVDGRKRLQS